MYVIKCFGFGKLLKQSFFIGLISFFILLVSSFVNADLTIVNYGSVGNLSSVSSDWNFNYDGHNYYNATNSSYASSRLWWQSDSFLHFNKRNYSSSSSLKGKITGFFVCDYATGYANVYLKNINSCEYYFGFGSEFMDLIVETNRWAYFYNSNSSNTWTILCGIASDDSFMVCVDYSYYENEGSGLMSESEILSVSVPNPNRSSNPGGQVWIPGTGSRLKGNLVVNSGYTNSEMIKGFECVGLQPALCYGGFDIDNIFDPSEQFEDFTGYRAGQGATIFEIYDLYSGSFTSLQQFLNTVLTRYQNGQINSFKTEPKALLMLGAQMNTAGFKTSYIASYCNLLLNENNNNIYTLNSVDDLRVIACLRSQEVGDSLKNGVDDIGFQTTTGGIFSGEDVDFDPDTFFSNIMNKIETSLNQDFTSGTAVGLIPGYIIVALLGLVFIRLITH